LKKSPFPVFDTNPLLPDRMSVPANISSILSWLTRNRRRMAKVGLGHVLYATFNWPIDNLLYVYAIYRLGLFTGGALMTAASLIQCALILFTYERMRIDWLGAGSLEALEHAQDVRFWQRPMVWALRKGNVLVFFVLSVFQDAFITTAYFRRGSFRGLCARDWCILFASVFVGNFYWTLRSGAVGALLLSSGGWFAPPPVVP